MTSYVPNVEQLVVEIFVHDARRSKSFYEQLGFKVAEADAYWRRVLGMNATVVAPVGDREYGLRDFTILDPDGFGIRFGSHLAPTSSCVV